LHLAERERGQNKQQALGHVHSPDKTDAKAERRRPVELRGVPPNTFPCCSSLFGQADHRTVEGETQLGQRDVSIVQEADRDVIHGDAKWAHGGETSGICPQV